MPALEEGTQYKVVKRSSSGGGSKSAIFSRMAEPRLNRQCIPGQHQHLTCLQTPAPNAYNVADANLETQKKLKFSASFLAQERPANVFGMQHSTSRDLSGPGTYDVDSKETPIDSCFCLNQQFSKSTGRNGLRNLITESSISEAKDSEALNENVMVSLEGVPQDYTSFAMTGISSQL